MIKETFDNLNDDFVDYKEDELFEDIENSIFKQQESLTETRSFVKIMEELFNYFDTSIRFNLSNEMKNMHVILNEINNDEILHIFEQVNYLILSVKNRLNLLRESNNHVMINLQKNDEEVYKMKNLVTFLNGKFINKRLVNEMIDKSYDTNQKMSKSEIVNHQNKNETAYYDDVIRLTGEVMHLKEKIEEINSHYIQQTLELKENFKSNENLLHEQVKINEKLVEKYNKKVLEYDELKIKYEKWMDDLINEEKKLFTKKQYKKHKSQCDFSKFKNSLNDEFSEDNLLQTNKVDLVYMLTELNLKLNKFKNELKSNYDLVEKYKILNKDLYQEKLNLIKENENIRLELDNYKYSNVDIGYNSQDVRFNNSSMKKSMLNCLTLEDLNEGDLFENNSSNLIELRKESTFTKSIICKSNTKENKVSPFNISISYNYDYPIQFSIFSTKKNYLLKYRERNNTPQHSSKRLELNTDKNTINKFKFLFDKNDTNEKPKKNQITKTMIENNISKINMINESEMYLKNDKDNREKVSKFSKINKKDFINQDSSSESNINSCFSIKSNLKIENKALKNVNFNDKVKKEEEDDNECEVQKSNQFNLGGSFIENNIDYDLLFLSTNEYVVRFLKKCSEDYHKIYSSEILILSKDKKDNANKKILITKQSIFILNDTDFFAINKISLKNVNISIFRPNIVVISKKDDFNHNESRIIKNYLINKSQFDNDQSLFTYNEDISYSNKPSNNPSLRNPKLTKNMSSEKIVMAFQDLNINLFMKFFLINFSANTNPNYFPIINNNFSYSKKVGILFLKKETFFSTYYDKVLVELTNNHLIIHHNFLTTKKTLEVFYLDKVEIISDVSNCLEKTISMKSTESFKAEVDEAKLLKLKHLAFSGIKFDSSINNRRFDLVLGTKKLTFIAYNNRLAESWYSQIKEIIECLD